MKCGRANLGTNLNLYFSLKKNESKAPWAAHGCIAQSQVYFCKTSLCAKLLVWIYVTCTFIRIKVKSLSCETFNTSTREYLTIIHRSGSKYPPLSPTPRWIIVLVYTTQAEQLADQRVTLFVTIYRQKPFCFSSASRPPLPQVHYSPRSSSVFKSLFPKYLVLI